MKRMLYLLSIVVLLLFGFSFAAYAANYTFTPLDDPNATNGTQAYGIYGGNIVGFYTDPEGSHGFLYDGTTWTPLDSPDTPYTVTLAYGIYGGNIVGSYTDPEGSHGFLYDGTTWTPLDFPFEAHTQAYGIYGGNIVGHYRNGGMVNGGFLYDGTTWTPLNAPSATATYANGIYGGNIVGSYIDATGHHGFLYDGTTWTPLNAPSATATYANGIYGGNIVGSYTDATGDHGFLVTLPSEEQIGGIQGFFDQEVQSGDLVGTGPTTKSAEGQVNALGNMLERAESLIESGSTEEACNQLNAIYKKTDGKTPPPDFVEGPAATQLAEQILALMDSLGCE